MFSLRLFVIIGILRLAAGRLALLRKVGLELEHSVCEPDQWKAIGKNGICASTDDLDAQCSDKEISSSVDCDAFDGHWCCYVPLPKTNSALKINFDLNKQSVSSGSYGYVTAASPTPATAQPQPTVTNGQPTPAVPSTAPASYAHSPATQQPVVTMAPPTSSSTVSYAPSPMTNPTMSMGSSGSTSYAPSPVTQPMTMTMAPPGSPSATTYAPSPPTQPMTMTMTMTMAPPGSPSATTYAPSPATQPMTMTMAPPASPSSVSYAPSPMTNPTMSMATPAGTPGSSSASSVTSGPGQTTGSYYAPASSNKMSGERIVVSGSSSVHSQSGLGRRIKHFNFGQPDNMLLAF